MYLHVHIPVLKPLDMFIDDLSATDLANPKGLDLSLRWRASLDWV